MGEPLIEAELIRFLAWDFTDGSWGREDLSLLKVALKEKNLDFPKARLPLPYHQQRALSPCRDRKIEWE